MMSLKRWIAAALAVALLSVTPAAVAQSPGGSYYFWWDVVDERGQAYTGQNVTCSVFAPNGPGAKTLHTTAAVTSGNTLPLVSDANGKLHFYSTTGDPVDVVCRYAPGGQIVSINRLSRTTHRIVLDRQGRKVAYFTVHRGPGLSGTQSSGISIPAGAVIYDVLVQNVNPRGVASAFHLSVGFAGNHAVAANADALVSALALTSPDEWLRPHMVCAGSAGLPIAACARGAGNHRGAALSFYHAEVYAGGNSTGVSIYREVPYLVHTSTGLDVTYATAVPVSGSANLHVYILYEGLHTSVNRLGLTN